MIVNKEHVTTCFLLSENSVYHKVLPTQNDFCWHASNEERYCGWSVNDYVVECIPSVSAVRVQVQSNNFYELWNLAIRWLSLGDRFQHSNGWNECIFFFFFRFMRLYWIVKIVLKLAGTPRHYHSRYKLSILASRLDHASSRVPVQ